MNLRNLIEVLELNPEATLQIFLPSGKFVPAHFHVTEVARIDKESIDCGGTWRESSSCLIQVWAAQDLEHRLFANKLAKILKCFSKELPVVEVEYGEDVAAHYTLSSVVVQCKELLLVLVGKKTDCLAPDKCGISCC
jgi:hypothetical protein